MMYLSFKNGRESERRQLSSLISTPWLRVSACAAILAIFLPTMKGQNFKNPDTGATFSQAIQGLTIDKNYQFGTGPGKTVTDLKELAASFSPYGIAGLSVINQEWERYQSFNSQNFLFTTNSLDLTATVPHGGGLFPGGINSGQIWSNETYQPTPSGHTVYAFEVRMRIPSGPGMWPAAWFYAKQPGATDGSEIDNPEFFNMKWQNEFDWTGFQHGPGQGPQMYSIKTNAWVWHPGLNFSADFHNFQTIWTTDAVYKYVDGTLVYAAAFRWTSKGPAQLGINLAVGTGDTGSMPGLQPTSLNEFPAALSIDHVTIWTR